MKIFFKEESRTTIILAIFELKKEKNCDRFLVSQLVFFNGDP